MSQPLWQLSAVEIAAGIRSRRYSCSEVMASVVERIRKLNPKLNAIVVDLTDQALAQAAAPGYDQGEHRPAGPRNNQWASGLR
jgi:amidase